MFPCSAHGGFVPGKLGTVYWRWFGQDGQSVGFKQRLCADCMKDSLKAVIAYAKSDSRDVSVCPVCGTDSSKDMAPLFITAYTPGSEGKDLQLPICEGCAPNVQAKAQVGAERLPDRGRQRGAMAPREPQDPFGDLWS